MRCLACGWSSANVDGNYCPNCGAEQFRNDLDSQPVDNSDY